MFTKPNIKNMVLKAYFYEELMYAEFQMLQDKGEKIIDDNKTPIVRSYGKEFLTQVMENKCTKAHIFHLQKKFKFFKNFYNQINKSVEAVTKKNTYLKGNWIPMYLFLAVNKKGSDYNIKLFDTDKNIDEMITAFTESMEIDKKLKLIYWKLARKILEDLEKL